MVIVGQQCGVASRNGEDAEMAATKGDTGAVDCAVGCAGEAAGRAGEAMERADVAGVAGVWGLTRVKRRRKTNQRVG